VDTLRELRRTDPRELYLILGRDTVAGLSRWHRPQELISLCYIATVPRPGVPELDVAALEVTLPGLREKLRLLSGPNIGISASEIRQRVVRGLPVHNLLPTGVEEYIREHGLYREG
jgi:nicotinate-nucleotide adenylyltransferase